MNRIIRIKRCEDCFYVRNLDNPEKSYCCIKKILNDTRSPLIRNTKRMPWWCPLEKESTQKKEKIISIPNKPNPKMIDYQHGKKK